MNLVFLDRFGNFPELGGALLPYPHIVLGRNTWNDYGFETLFSVELRTGPDEASRLSLGNVKIGFRGQKPTDPPMRVSLTGLIARLPEDHFSLGQRINYYHLLADLPQDLRQDYAAAMRDIPILQTPLDALDEEQVFRVSLLRSGLAIQALDQARALFGAQFTIADRFTFTTRIAPNGDHVVPFDFEARDGLPRRINVLVGVNGVGKTQLMARLAVALSRFEEEDTQKARTAAGETFEVVGIVEPRPSFYNVVAVSFSAFDDFELPQGKMSKEFEYVYCGIRKPDRSLATVDELANRIPAAIRRMSEEKLALFNAAAAVVLPALAQQALPNGKAFYSSLSAGQKILLNILGDLALNLRERSLVLLDEPETHLHPQLITTLMTALGVMLEEMDAFAIVATHSPLVVQQVLAKHVHVVHRIEDGQPLVNHPASETFGGNLSEIVRMVFDAGEADRDYQEIIDRLFVTHNRSIEAVEALFGGQLGLNASVYLHSLEQNDAG